MSVVTTYTCDKCARVQETSDDMFHVALVVRPCTSTLHYARGEMLCTQLWCLTCVGEKLKHLIPHTPDAPPPTPPTLEGMIKEIVQDEMEGGG